jgi:NAD(P)-dependent dehydrogenase (short-subunit alcohol dehydrogenase family)
MSNLFKIAGSVVLVTGANRGIGKALVEALAAGGAAKIYAAARKPESVAPLVEALGPVIVPVALDLNSEDLINAAADMASDVQLVINNGASFSNTTMTDPHLLQALGDELNTNVVGMARMVQAFGPVLKNNGGGVFAQVGSLISMIPIAPQATYSAVKAATYALTMCLSESFKEQGTHVLSIHPGPFATDMLAESGFIELAEPVEICSRAVMQALEDGSTHVFAGTISTKGGEAHRSFREAYIEPGPDDVFARLLAG